MIRESSDLNGKFKMNKAYLILHKPYHYVFHFQTAYTQAKVKYLKVSGIVLYSRTNYNAGVTHTEPTRDPPLRYTYYRMYCHRLYQIFH